MISKINTSLTCLTKKSVKSVTLDKFVILLFLILTHLLNEKFYLL